MPISPSEIAERRVTQKKKDLKFLYDRIDAALINGRNYLMVPEDIDSKYINDVLVAYAEAGWLVKAWNTNELDQDGPPNRVDFTEKTNRDDEPRSRG